MEKSFLRKWAALCCLFAFVLLLKKPCLSQSISAYDLISLMNGSRAANGLSPLSTDPYLMACAQGTAETMAANSMTWHIGNASGRVSSYGYNGGGDCFATENFMMGSKTTTISQIASVWADATHQIAATNPKYVHAGAGVAVGSDGMVYFVFQAAYPAGSPGAALSGGNASGGAVFTTADVSQLVKNVVVATPDESGVVYHEVQDGQSLWTIATAYGVSVEDIRGWNNMNESSFLSLGQKLFIPDKSMAGKTPTPQIELTVLPTADEKGKYKHTVKDGETLWSISELWRVSLNALYQANGLNEESSIGLNWVLNIPVTPTITPIPSDTPTITPTAEDTATPTPTLEVTPTATFTPTSEHHIGHLPKADHQTYLILGIFALVGLGGTLLGVEIYKTKRKK